MKFITGLHEILTAYSASSVDNTLTILPFSSITETFELNISDSKNTLINEHAFNPLEGCIVEESAFLENAMIPHLEHGHCPTASSTISFNLLEGSLAVEKGQDALLDEHQQSSIRSTLGTSTKHVHFPDDERMISEVFRPFEPLFVTRKIEAERQLSSDSLNVHEILQAYLNACKHNKIQASSKIEKQISCFHFNELDRQEILSLRGDKLTIVHLDSLEEIFKRVQFINLDFEYCFLDDETVVALCDMLEFYESAKKLNLSFNQSISSRGWQAVFRMVKQSSCLEQLDLRYTSINERSLPLLSRTLKSPDLHLTSLHLENCSLSGKSILLLATAMKFNCTIRDLHLADNNLVPTDAAHIYQIVLHNSTLEWLDLRNNSVQDQGFAHICDALKNPECISKSKLNTLVLWNNKLTRHGMTHLARVLLENVVLRTINLGCNDLSDEGVAIIRESLARNKTLLRLGLQDTKLHCPGAIAIAEALADNTSLIRVDLRDNPGIMSAGLLALRVATKMNYSLTSLNLDKPSSNANHSGSHQSVELLRRLHTEIADNCTRNYDFYFQRLQTARSNSACSTSNSITSTIGVALSDSGTIESKNHYDNATGHDTIEKVVEILTNEVVAECCVENQSVHPDAPTTPSIAIEDCSATSFLSTTVEDDVGILNVLGQTIDVSSTSCSGINADDASYSKTAAVALTSSPILQKAFKYDSKDEKLLADIQNNHQTVDSVAKLEVAVLEAVADSDVQVPKLRDEMIQQIAKINSEFSYNYNNPSKKCIRKVSLTCKELVDNIRERFAAMPRCEETIEADNVVADQMTTSSSLESLSRPQSTPPFVESSQSIAQPAQPLGIGALSRNLSLSQPTLVTSLVSTSDELPKVRGRVRRFSVSKVAAVKISSESGTSSSKTKIERTISLPQNDDQTLISLANKRAYPQIVAEDYEQADRCVPKLFVDDTNIDTDVISALRDIVNYCNYSCSFTDSRFPVSVLAPSFERPLIIEQQVADPGDRPIIMRLIDDLVRYASYACRQEETSSLTACDQSPKHERTDDRRYDGLVSSRHSSMNDRSFKSRPSSASRMFSEQIFSINETTTSILDETEDQRRIAVRSVIRSLVRNVVTSYRQSTDNVAELPTDVPSDQRQITLNRRPNAINQSTQVPHQMFNKFANCRSSLALRKHKSHKKR